ncbi:MAG TPA: GNAT family N-acetyltransferase [Jatrophihabitans sp.]|nr:GNAT family N-acetyltransferase [Jatrophihabitans sp.]
MIRYVTGTEGIDWAALKAALAADEFDNGRTPEQYRISHENSYGVIFAFDGDRLVGNGRVLSDGVCNAYLVDIWTASSHRRQGIGSELVRRLTEGLAGQHVGLFTDDLQPFYASLGFRVRPDFMDLVVGTWLDNDGHP